MYKEYYMNYLSTVERTILKKPLDKNDPIGKMCYHMCLKKAIQAIQEDNNKVLYSNIIGLIFLYE
jgi:hypothetical protein